jgi:OPA family glycerol-3-phosphate transporter-like MFS transporter/OPA family sugar phosphate sensor protein UhpC-like MFS transporter
VAVICGYLTRWQLCFWVPAAIAFVGIFFILITLRDTPKSVGLQELPKVKGELDDGEQKDPKAFRQFLMKKVFLNPVIWVLAITDLFVYIVRFAILDWGPSMLSDMGLSKELTGWTVAIFEIAGCAGMLCAGYISDKFFNSRSQRVCAIEMSLVAACLLGLHFLQDAGHPVFFLILLALAGFLIYGPQALLGVTAANIATKKAASSAVGLIGLMSYLSTIITGVGFGALADKFGGWSWIFITMGGLAVVGAVLILTIWGLKEGSAEE